jgi:hypothetical protein
MSSIDEIDLVERKSEAPGSLSELKAKKVNVLKYTSDIFSNSASKK